MLILERYPDWQQSQWIVALGIFSSITSTIAAYEFIIKRFIHQDEADGKHGKSEIINGQNLQITGGQQDRITQQDMREQTVRGHQVNIAGDAKGPIFINAAAKLSPPLQKPPRSQHFIGRETELASLLKDLQPGRAVTICGPGGMGKTALTAQAIWQLAPSSDPPYRFPDGIIFHTFYHKPQAALALEAIARAYCEDPRQSPFEAAKKALAGRRALIVLDGAEACDDLQSILSIAGSCAVLITTRRHGDAPDDFSDLPPLPEDKAVELLQAWGGSMAADERICRSICILLGGLPLAIFLAGRYLSHRRQLAGDYLAWLKKTPLEALDLGDRQHQSIPLLMEHSLEQVSDRAKASLGLTGVLAFKPFEAEIITAALQISEQEANLELGELVDYGLLTRPDLRYQITHTLAHTYARASLPVPSGALARLAQYYTDFSREQTKNGLSGYSLLDSQRDHILAVQSACNKAELWGEVRTLTWAIKDYLGLQGHWEERVSLLQTGLQAARSNKASYDEAAFLNLLGLTSAALGDARKAIEYHEQSLAIAREIGDRRGEGANLGNMGSAYAALGDTRKAIEYYEQALVIDREIGDRRGEGNDLGNMGLAYANLGDTRKAIEYYEQALVIDREIGDRRGEGNALGNMGMAYANLGDTRKAFEYHEQALVISREIGDRKGEGNALWNMSLALHNLDKPSEAIKKAESALLIYKQIESPVAARVEKKLAEWRM
ncbi:MAG: tetratricopeptide repeat protein [Methanothrix sp.]|nr:tetratricopeptide repeat protein [Methanothrix sp.]